MIKHYNTLFKTAKRANHRQHRMACILVRGGSIVASGYNTNHIHAEHTALNRAGPGGAVGATAFVVRFRSNGDLGMARPCYLCTQRLMDAGVKKVHYSDVDGGISTLKLVHKPMKNKYLLEYHFKRPRSSNNPARR